MCGVCGTIGLPPDIVTLMSRSMVHRGPDDTGVWCQGDIALGHARLSIIDTTHAGHQPMANEDASIWITFNGEIYNFKSLRKDLEKKGHTFTSFTDTEVIIHLYEEYGQGCLRYLRGMFAFAIWDKKNRRLFAARDRLGIKPFFYYYNNGKFIFASELKAMLTARSIVRELDAAAVQNYFAYGSVAAPLTLIKNIFQLLPGHCLILENSTLSDHTYWEAQLLNTTGSSSHNADYTGEIARGLEESVALRMTSDVPIGAFLSGGIDSSIIAALMQKNSTRPIKTFSVVFKEKKYDERSFSSQIATMLGTDHEQIEVHASDIASSLPDIFNAMDQPSVDGFNTFVISKAVRASGLKVALSGLGGDELFAGYSFFRRLYRLLPLIRSTHTLPVRLRQQLFAHVSRYARTRRQLKLAALLLCGSDLKDMHALQRMVFLPQEQEKILVTPCLNIFSRAEQLEAPDVINALSLYELTTYLRDTLLQDTDRMSMAHGLEVRVPFLDHIFVEKLLKIPGDLKIKGAHPKRLLVEAMKDMLPQEVCARRKMGFVFPFDVWLKGPLRDFCAQKLSRENTKKISVLNANSVDALWNKFLKGSTLYNYSSVLSLLSFVLWYERDCS